MPVLPPSRTLARRRRSLWHSPRCHSSPATARWLRVRSPAKRYSILIRIDSAGRCPVLVHEGDEPLTSRGVRWKQVAAADNYDEAIWLMEVAHRQCARHDTSP